MDAFVLGVVFMLLNAWSMLVFLLFLVLIALGFGLLAPVWLAVDVGILGRKCSDACPPSRHPEFLRALVCGDRTPVNGERAVWSPDFEKTGLVHLIIVSGMHLVLLESFCSRVLSSRARTWVLSLILGLYVITTGASPPVVRAFCAFAFRRLSHSFGWNWTRVQTLTCSGFAALLFCRTRFDLVALFLGWIASLAFEFASGLGSLRARALAARRRPQVWRDRVERWRAVLFVRVRAQVAVYVALVPGLLALGVPSVVSVVTNLVVAPGLAFVLFPASVAAFVVPDLVRFVDALWDFGLWLVHWVAWMTPSAWERVEVSPVALVAYVFVLTLFFRYRERVRRGVVVVVCLVGVSLVSRAGAASSAASSAAAAPSARVDELVVWNIGQGSWATLRVGERCEHFDIGGEWAPSSSALAFMCGGIRNVVNYSHWDWDHVGLTRAALHVLPNLCVGNTPGGPAPSKFKASLIGALPRCELSRSPVPSVGSSASEPREIFLSHMPADVKLHDPNDYSRVFVEDRVIFPGDSPKREELKWRSDPSLLSARVLVAGHHGSKTSTSEELLARLPHLKMIVASAHYVRYGHPHPAMLARAQKFLIPVIRTEDWGSLHFELGARSLGTLATDPTLHEAIEARSIGTSTSAAGSALTRNRIVQLPPQPRMRFRRRKRSRRLKRLDESSRPRGDGDQPPNADAFPD